MHRKLSKQKIGDTIGEKEKPASYWDGILPEEAPTSEMIEGSGIERRFYEKRDDGKFYCLVVGCCRNKEPLDSYEKFYQHFINMHCTKSIGDRMIARQRSLIRSEKIRSGEFFHKEHMGDRLFYTDETLRTHSICPFDSCSKKIPFINDGYGKLPDKVAEQRHLKDHKKLFESRNARQDSSGRRKRTIPLRRRYTYFDYFNKDRKNEQRIERLRTGKHDGTRFGDKVRTKDKDLKEYYEQLVEEGWYRLASYGDRTKSKKR